MLKPGEIESERVSQPKRTEAACGVGGEGGSGVGGVEGCRRAVVHHAGFFGSWWARAQNACSERGVPRREGRARGRCFYATWSPTFRYQETDTGLSFVHGAVEV